MTARNISLKNMSVYGEIRGHIQSLQLVVCLQSQGNRFDLIVCDNEIKVKSGKTNWNFCLPNIQLIPNSCHNLTWVKGEGTHMIFRIKDHSTSQDNESHTFEEALANSEYTLVCATCRMSILKPICQFNRVCQLPSDHWQEMVEDWQCHASEDVALIARKTLVPSTKDCFINSTSLIVSPEVIGDDALNLSKETVAVVNKTNKDASIFKWLNCTRCHSLLGKVFCKAENDTNHWKTFSSLEIFQYTVEIASRLASNVVQPKRTPRLEIFLSNYLLNISKTYMAFRFIVQSEEDSKIYALIWLINTEMKLLTSPKKMNEKIAKFTGAIEETQEVKSLVESSKIVKILYEQCLGGAFESLAEQWNKDMAVHSIILPKPICLHVLLLLATNTSRMPRSLQKQNNFKVGFLRLR